MKFRWLIVLIVLVGAIESRPTAAQDDELPPYIMYFVGDGFRIERADGSDSRLFGEGIEARARDYASGPGWSPSGEWFAWVYHQGYIWYDGGAPVVMSVDERQRVTFPDDVSDAELYWAPDRDLLLGVLWRTKGGWRNRNALPITNYPATLEIVLIDPTTDTMRSVFSADVDSPYPTSIDRYYLAADEILWLEDSVVVMALLGDGYRWKDRNVRLRVSFDGHVIERFEYPIRHIPTLGAPDVPNQRYGLLSYRTTTGFYLYEPLSETVIPFELGDLVQDILWNPTETGALIRSTSQSWYLYRDPSTGGWSIMLLGGVQFSYRQNYYNHYVAWSPDGRWALLEDNTTSQYRFWDSVHRTQTVIPLPAEATMRPLFWSTDSMFVFLVEEDRQIQYNLIIDPATVTQTRFEPAFYNNSAVSGELIFVGSQRPSLYDRASGERLYTYNQTVYNYFEMGIAAIEPHPAAPYFIIATDSSTASGGGFYRYSLNSFDGQLQRGIGDDPQWLPAQVDVDRLPAAVSRISRLRPAQRLEPPDHVLYWNYFVQWSPDGTQIGAGGDGETLIYDVASGDYLGRVEMNYSVEVLDWSGDGLPTAIERFENRQSDEPLLTSPDGRYEFFRDGLIDTTTNITVLRYGPYLPEWSQPSFSPDGRYFAIEGVIYELETLTYVTGFAGVNGMAFSPDGTRLAVGRGSFVEIWDVAALLSSE